MMGATSAGSDRFDMYNDWNIFDTLTGMLPHDKERGLGSLVLTNLYNYTFPIIRYNINTEYELQILPMILDHPFSNWAKLPEEYQRY